MSGVRCSLYPHGCRRVPQGAAGEGSAERIRERIYGNFDLEREEDPDNPETETEDW